MQESIENAERTGVFEKHGSVWTIEFAGLSAHLDDLVGLHYLAILLAHPGERFPAIELLFACASECSKLSKRSTATGHTALSVTERARFRISRAIRTAVGRIAGCHTSLGLHLRATIHTGSFFAYDPQPGMRISWRTGGTPSDGDGR